MLHEWREIEANDMYVAQWPKIISTTLPKKVDWRQKQVQQTIPLGIRFSNFQLGSKDLNTCFWLVQKFLQFYNTKTVFSGALEMFMS